MEQPAQKVNTAVFDKGRRGAPRPGCDCVVCFGYCMSDRDRAVRDSFSQAEPEPTVIGDNNE